jgi:hypothetical protein
MSEIKNSPSSENFEVTDNLRDLGIDGRIIFRLYLEKEV